MSDQDAETRRRDLRQAIYAAAVVRLIAAPEASQQTLAVFADVAAAFALQVWQARDAERLPAIPSAQEVTPDRPLRCDGVREARCAVVTEDARLPRGNFDDPHAWQCVGCAVRGSGAAVEGAE